MSQRNPFSSSFLFLFLFFSHVTEKPYADEETKKNHATLQQIDSFESFLTDVFRSVLGAAEFDGLLRMLSTFCENVQQKEEEKMSLIK